MSEENILEAETVTNDTDKEGIIQIADSVVTTIVGLAVTEVEGVSKLSGGITRDIVSKLGKNMLSNGVKVNFAEDKSITSIDVSIEIKYGFNVKTVSVAVQSKVREALQTMTGMKADIVNVRVTGVDFSEK